MILLFDRFLLFLIIGGVATGVHWGLMYLLIQQSMQAALATTIGAVAGFIVAFVGHIRITFPQSNGGVIVLSRFTATACLALGINLALFLFFTSLTFSTAIAQVLSTAGATVCNYITNKQFVFSEGKSYES